MKINYNKFKQIVNKLQNLNLCKSINDNNNNNNFGRSNLPSINFQKIIKVTDNSPTEKPFSKKKKLYITIISTKKVQLIIVSNF